MDLDATHNIFKNKYPKAKEEMEERLQVCVCVFVCRQHVHYLFMNSYFASTLMLALKKKQGDYFVGILVYHHKYHGGKALFSKKIDTCTYIDSNTL